MRQRLAAIGRNAGLLEFLGLAVVVLFLASHGLHLEADPATRMGWWGPVDWSGDLFTDEGWATAGAVAGVVRGHWYVPGDFNLAVDAPLWPVLLYLPFKLWGVSIVVARAMASGLFAATVALVYLFVRRYEGRRAAMPVALLLAVNFLAMTFSRMALLEAAWLFLVMASLVVAQRGSTHRLWSSGLAGLVLGLALLTKLTAIAGLLPLLVLLFRQREGRRDFLSRAGLCCAALASVVVPYRIFVLVRYPLDHRLYSKINVADRAVKSVGALARELSAVLRASARLDIALYACLWIGALLLILRWRRGRMSAVEAICVSWLAANVAVCSVVTYFPPRYCMSLLAPATVLAVVWTRSALRWSRPLGYGLAALLAVSFGLNLAETAAYELHPSYSYREMCRAIEVRMQREGVEGATVMGTFANTVALYTASPALDDDLGTVAREDRIVRFRPKYYVSIGPATDAAVEDFRRSGASLGMAAAFDVLKNYSTHEAVHLYEVR